MSKLIAEVRPGVPIVFLLAPLALGVVRLMAARLPAGARGANRPVGGDQGRVADRWPSGRVSIMVRWADRATAMLTLLKLLQSLIKTLHSEGSPNQIALGMALGAALGLTPLVNLHNLVIVTLLIILNVSFGAGMLALAVFAPLGFLLDPVFDSVGRTLLLDTPSLRPLWVAWQNTPGLPYTNFNNSVVLGSFVGWLVLAIPIYLAARLGVLRYRATVAPKVQASRFYRAVTASKAYNIYRWFRPE